MEEAAPETLFLAGYVRMTRQGYALPCFTASRQHNPNIWYVATCTPAGDHLGQISGFDLFVSDDIRRIPEVKIQACRLGEPWRDVFLWEDEPYVGDPATLWAQLKDHAAALAQLAPLSLFRLSLDAPGADRANAGRAALNYLTRRRGVARAAQWQTQTYQAAATVRIWRVLGQKGAGRLQGLEVVRTGNEVRVACALEAPDEATRAGGVPALAAELGSLASDLAMTFAGLNLKSPREPAPTSSFEGSISGLEAVILPVGRVANRVARLVGSPEWAPAFIDGKDTRVAELPRTVGVLGVDKRPPQPETLGVVVFLISEDNQPGELPDSWASWLEALEGANVPILVAPVPPEDRPSEWLTEPGPGHLPPAHALVDTSLARSPFWVLDGRRSFERGVADISVAAALLALCPPIRARLLKDGASHSPPILAYRLGRYHDRDEPPRSESASPGSGPDERFRYRARFAAVPLRRSGLGSREHGVVEIRDVGPDFRSFVTPIVMDICAAHRIGASPRREIRSRYGPSAFDAGFELHRPDKTIRLIVSANTPALDDVAHAAGSGWCVARYTDQLSIGRFADGDLRGPGSVPDHVRLPPLRRIGANRGLAARGLRRDQVFVLTEHEHMAWCQLAPNSSLKAAFRRVRRTTAPWDAEDGRLDVREVAIPLSVLHRSLEAQDDSARLLSRFTGKRASFQAIYRKRPSQLGGPWPVAQEGGLRLLLADGRTPVQFGVLEPDEIPGHNLFVIDTDPWAAAFFASRVFELWARTTAVIGPGGQPRFTLSRTFESLPLPSGLHVRHTPMGATLRWEMGQEPYTATSEFHQWLRARPQMHSDDSHLPPRGSPTWRLWEADLLKAYGLPEEADDVTILERLVALNHLAT